MCTLYAVVEFLKIDKKRSHSPVLQGHLSSSCPNQDRYNDYYYLVLRENHGIRQPSLLQLRHT